MAEDEVVRRWSGDGPESAALLNAIFDAADIVAGIFEVLDDDYRYVVANRNTTAFYERPPGSLNGVTGREMGLDAAQIETRLATLRECLSTGETQTAEYPFRVEGGRSGWFFGTFSPIPGDRPWVSFVVLDVTERRNAQVQLLKQSARLGLALDATGLGLWEYDLTTDTVDWDGRMRTLFGVPQDKPIDFATYAAAVHPEDFPAVEAAYRDALGGANGGGYVVEHRTTSAGAAGSARWIRGAARVVFDKATGKPRRVIGTAQDISEQVEARKAQDLLLAELNHRVKNNLATVQAIARHTLKAAEDDPVAFQRAFESRIMSLARGHDLLTRNAWRTAALGEVFDVALAPFSAQAIRMVGGRADARVTPDLAVNLVMVLNELATNAGKYGALSAPGGEVAVDWVVEEGVLLANWRERGGPQVTAPSQTGFGGRLIRTALSAFGGAAVLDFPPEGAACRISVPLDGGR